MSKVLALLSGKGGSGKTTMALSIASMLSDCRLKVLLVDCDFNTNGATYFYEDLISEESSRITSFYDIIMDGDTKEDNSICINEYLYFMPSITKIVEGDSNIYNYNTRDSLRMSDIDKKLREQYDVVIYDFQAGYTDILKLMLPYVDVNLVVMEADSISSSSIRSLYLKIGNLFDNKKVYQIFNKVTDGEYDVYTKLSGGTVFTNIETVKFDWKIRKAFSLSQIPDMGKTSAVYGEQVYNICEVIFKEKRIREKMKLYKNIILINKKREQEKEIKKEIGLLDDKRNSNNKKLFTGYSLVIPLFLSTILAVFAFILKIPYYHNEKEEFLFGIVVVMYFIVTIFGIILVYITTKERRIKNREKNVAINKLNETIAERELYEKQLQDIRSAEEH